MGRKKEKVRWTSVDKGFFARDDSSMKVENDSSHSFNRKQPWTNGGFANRSHLCMTQIFQSDKQEGARDDKVESPSDPSSHEATEHRCSSCEANSHTSGEVDVQSNLTTSHERSTISPSTIEFDFSSKKPLPLKTEEESLGDSITTQAKTDPELYQEGKEDSDDGPKKSIINENASPFYPNSYISPTLAMFTENQNRNPLTLYLYTPGTQSAVPCDEIVIASPIIAPYGSTLFPNPSNVYFPYDGMMNHIEFLGPQATSCGLIQYDQYGIPYTTFSQHQPLMSLVSPKEESAASPFDIKENTVYSSTSLTGCSVDSTPNSPPEFSSPANWNESNGIEHEEYTHDQWFPQELFYQQHPWSSKVLYSKNSDLNFFYEDNEPISYNEKDGYWPPTSRGGSHEEKEDKSKNTIAFSGIKDEMETKDRPKELPAQRLIPGLPDNFVKLAAKKSHKKKNENISDAPTTTKTLEKNLTYKVQDNLKLSASKYDSNHLDEKEAKKFQLTSLLPQAEATEADIPTVQEPVCVNIAEISKEPAQQVQIINDDEWEIVPNEIKESKSDSWETSKRKKRSRKGGRQIQAHYVAVSETCKADYSFQIQRDDDPKKPQPKEDEKSHEKSIKPTKVKVDSEQLPKHAQKQSLRVVEARLDTNPSNKTSSTNLVKKSSEQPSKPYDRSNQNDELDMVSQTSMRSASVSSVPSSIDSPKNKQKKRSTKVENKSDQNVKQVFVHDGILNFTDGMAGSKRLLNRPIDQINEHAFILKDIGHGMRFGPMGTGRISQGCYQLHDRSTEILLQFMKQHCE